MSKRNILIGVIVVLVLAALGSSGGSSRSGSEATATTSSGADATPPTTPDVTPEPAADGPIDLQKGAPVEVDGIEITMLDAAYSKEGFDFQKPASGQVYVAYQVKLKNTGTDSKFVSSSDWVVLSDGEQQGNWTIVVNDAWEPLLSLDNLRGGASITGWLVFETPAPSQFVRLIYDPSFFSDEVKLQYDVTLN